MSMRRTTCFAACQYAVLVFAPQQRYAYVDGTVSPTKAPTYTECFGQGSTARILPLGDSITWGLGGFHCQPPAWVEEWPPSQEACGYRVPLYSMLVADGLDVEMVGSQRTGPANAPDAAVHHEGHSGWTIAQLERVLDRCRDHRPTHVLLHIGTNDVRNAAEGVSGTVIAERLRRFLDRAFEEMPGVTIFVASIIDMPKTPRWRELVLI